MTESSSAEITARDDNFHFDDLSDRWWITETAWFSFCKPEIGLAGWVYNMFRPNIGTVAGGCWIWDASASSPWEVLYSANYTAMPLQKDADLNDITLRTGVSLKTLEPLTKYQIGFKDENRIDLNLIFDAVMPPRPMQKNDGSFQKLSHFDQFGRVHGTIDLYGEKIDIDCLAIRDRSWGPRPEHRPGKSAYVSGIASPECAFLAVTKWNDPDSHLSNGFMTLDGKTANIVSGKRTVIRDPATGYVDRIVIDAKDDLGRDMHAEGKRLSGIVINRHSFIDSNSLIEWTINGQAGHGEDQDMWPVYSWSEMRREMRSQTKI